MHHENIQNYSIPNNLVLQTKLFILFEYLKSENNEREYGSGKTELHISIIVRYCDPKWTYTCLCFYRYTNLNKSDHW